MITPKIDLHFHSNFSDGKLSVSAIADIIKTNQIKICSLTDHDSVEGINEFKNFLSGSEILVIPGVELTAKFGYNEIHILAYDFDINVVTEILKERNEIVRQQKIEEMEKAVVLSREQGFDITNNLSPLPRQPVSLTIALDICSKKTNQNILVVRHGKEFIPEDIFYEYQAPGKPCFVERSGVTVEWLINKFKGVAGDLIIGHPFVSVSVVTKPLDETEIYSLIKAGMTGIEIYHNHTSDDQIKFLKEIVDERQICYTGGSDSHGKLTNTPIGEYGRGNFVPSFKLTSYISGDLNIKYE